MLVENQNVKVKWMNCNIEWYTSKGYVYTKYLDEFFVDIKDLQKGSKSFVKVVCDYCGEIYECRYYSYKRNNDSVKKDCCKKCKLIKSNEVKYINKIDKRYNKIKKICDENNYILLSNKEDLGDVKSTFKFICPKHGEQSCVIDTFIHGARCYLCGREKVGDKNRMSPEDVEKRINSIGGNILLNKNEYVNNSTRNLKIKCGTCNKNIYTTSLASYNDGVIMCPYCAESESKNERIIKGILEYYNILFEAEKRFDDCRDIKPLPFDFYISSINLIIEYDGEGHYLESFYKNRFDNPKEALEHTKFHDDIKTQYCKDNNINLLRIPYWEKYNIETIILDNLKLYGYEDKNK